MTTNRRHGLPNTLTPSLLNRKLSSLVTIWKLFEVPRWALVAIAAVSVVAGVCDAAVIALVVEAAAAIAAHQRHVTLNLKVLRIDNIGLGPVLGIALLAVLLGVVFGLVQVYLPIRMGTRAAFSLRKRTIAAYLGAEWPLQIGVRQGGFVDLLTQQTEYATEVAINVGNVLASLVNFLALSAAAALVSPAAFLGVILMASFLFLVLRPIAKLGQQRAKLFSEASQRFALDVDTFVGLAEEIKIFGAEGPVRRTAFQKMEEIRKHRVGMDLSGRAIWSAYQDLATLGVVIVLLVLSALPHLNIAALGAVVLILLRAMSAGQAVQTYYVAFRQRLPFARRIHEVMGELESGPSLPGEEPLGDIQELLLRDVRFGYNKSQPVLKGVSASIQRGELVALVGPSGAGKSTLLQILLRLREPDLGDYLVNGRSAASYAPDEWSKAVAYVPQDPKVLHASVADNIRFFRDIPLEEIIWAARVAQIHSDIQALSNGYDSEIGQRMEALSGGQRQRLCLARALVGHPRVLILDEPTSALDDASERLVHAALASLRGQVTTVVVAHRPGILEVCDRVLTMKNGVIGPGPDDVSTLSLMTR